MVWLADIIIVLFSYLLTYTHNGVAPHPDYVIFSVPVKISVVIATYGLADILTHNHRYVVRLSAFSDVARLIRYHIGVSMFLLILSIVCEIVTGVRYFMLWNIFTLGICSFSLMTIMRLSIKSLYTVIQGSGANRCPVIVLGTSLNSLMLASALKDEINGKYEPVALLSLNVSTKATINGLPVVNYDKTRIKAFFRKYGAETLIFSSSQLEIIRQQLADDFLANSIRLIMFNSVEEFNSNHNATDNLSAHVEDIKIEDLLGREPINTGSPMVSRTFLHQTVMVTGAAGSIGSEIVNQLAKFQAKEIVLIDQAETPMHDLHLRMQKEHPDIKTHLFIGDITNRERMEQAFIKYRPRYVFHAAAYKHVPMMEINPSEAVCTNVFGTKNIADLAVKYDVEKFVMISTDKAVNPTNIMGASKRIAEIYVQSLFFHQRKLTDQHTTQFITTRFGNVLGSNGSVIPLFKHQIEEGGPVTITHRDIIRYFMTIPEACSLVLEAASMGQGGEIYIFDMGQPVKIYDLAKKMISLAGLRPGIDIKIVETGLRPGEKLYEELLNDKERTIATHHKQIMIARVIVYEYEKVLRHLENLSADIHKSNIHDIVAHMKIIVPEFVSKNSKWQEIDKELSKQKNPQ